MEFDHDDMYCGSLRRGDIVLHIENKKEVPAVVLQDDMLNQGLPTVICASIEPYSTGQDVCINEVFLKKEETGLGKDGVCMLHRLSTINRKHILAKKAELPVDSIEKLYEAVDVTLGKFRDKK